MSRFSASSAAWEANERQARAYEVLVEETPCDKCEFRQRCADELLACTTFMRYMQQTWGTVTWKKMTEPRVPTRELFLEMSKPSYDEIEKMADPEFERRWNEMLAEPPSLVGDAHSYRKGRYEREEAADR
jgi:hypothetical protein